MRFDDMLATLLAQPREGQEARTAFWRQLVDLLAQGRFADSSDLSDDALNYIVELRSTIPAHIKAETARAFVGRPINVAVVALFAEEPAPVIAPIIAAADISVDDWLMLLPTLTPTARGLLRHRRNLPKDVVRALDSFGHSDFVIPTTETADVIFFVPDREIEKPVSEDAIPENMVDDSPETDVVAEFEPVEAPEEVTPVPFAAVDAVAEALADVKPHFTAAGEIPLDGEFQIRELMARIEAYREHDFVRPTGDDTPDSPRLREDDDGFRFETGADGTIIWAVGISRAAVIGETIAVAAYGSDHGVDGYAAGAFRQRAPFRDARLTLGGDGRPSGEWRISAVPVFDIVDGRFNGYRGTARRPRVDEIASPTPNTGPFGDPGTGDSLRQLVHELRTPLNAIIGFSEMIEGQFLGPASAAYRGQASDIKAHGKRLLNALEDLDTTVRYEPGRDRGSVDPAQLMEKLYSEYLPVAEERGCSLKFRVAPQVGMVQADPIAVERMFARLLSGILGVAQDGEKIAVHLDLDPDIADRMTLTVARPSMLMGRDERTLLDPGYNPDGDWPDAPVLGLGFALRLVRNIASSAGGVLDIQPEALILRLPLHKISARMGKG